MRGGGSIDESVAAFGRTVLVISEGNELAVALRDRLDRAYVTVRDAHPDEACTVLRGCRPWPWMVIGDVTDVPAAVITSLAGRPVLVLWHGTAPRRLANTRTVERFSEMAGAVVTAMRGSPGGMRLAPGAGVTMPDGRHVGNPALEALVASHPCGLVAAARHFRGVDAVLESHGTSMCMEWMGRGGLRILAEAG